MKYDEPLCPICNEPRHNSHHNNTLNHRYHFMKWAYNEYRKPLQKNRHGVELDIEVERINNFLFDFRQIKGKYVTKVTPQQLQLHNCSLSFKCNIKNTRKDAIYITSTNLLHSSKYYIISHSNEFEEPETFVQLPPGTRYTFKIIFETDILTSASYKIPLSCDFQTNDNKMNFSIVRTFLTIVDDSTETLEEKIKSPFTNQTWKEVKKTIPSLKETNYADKYPIPPNYIKLLIYGLQRFNGMTGRDECTTNELKQLLERLTKDNYSRFWHLLLWMEEISESLMLMKYNMEKVCMKIKNDEILELEVPGLAEKRPSIIVGDFIKIRLTGDHTAYKGFVCKINEKTIEISHVDDEFMNYLCKNPEEVVDVSFMLGRLAFERMHSAVDTIVSTGMVNKLFPKARNSISNPTHQLHDSQLFNQSICHNNEQKNAVCNILNSLHDLPYIIFGPPGTGKTITIVEAILQIKKRTKKRILVCAPANSACDMLALRLSEHCNNEELIRIHSSTRDKSTVPEELKEYSNIEDGEFTKIMIDKLLSYRIVVTTLVLIGRFAGKYHPNCVFIDEAAQASEPETDIAIAMVNVGQQVVLAGDPKQLGPMTSKSTEKFGLGTPLMQRLMECDIYQLNRRTRMYDNNFITMLRLNFRSHPDILSIPNELFYNKLLKPISQTAQRDPLVDIAIYPTIKKSTKKIQGRAIEFCSVSAKERREGSSPSYFNLFESKMVVNYVRAMHSLHLAEAYKVRTDQIGVVTPYKRQVHKIKEALRRNGFAGVEVGTTESFQGREKRIIIISTVRAQHSLLLHDRKYNLGFVKHDQRFNVAVTRAISKLIVIGCPLVLRTDDKWAKYLKLCDDYGTYYGNLFEADDEDFRQDVINRMKRFKHKDDQYNL